MSDCVNYGDDAPIAAFATTPGNSALTLIRCSGNGSIEIAASVFSAPQRIAAAQGNTVIHGWIVKAGNNKQLTVNSLNRTGNGEPVDGGKIDEVLVSVFRAPKSYTGEDGLDICCHGGNAAGRAVMAALKTAGFRDALPGEFTFRAFMNGKLDLTRSESVMELVSAKTEEARSNAVTRLFGALESEINEIKKQLVEVLSGAEIYLDYSEDEISAGSDADAAEEIAGKLPGRDIAQEALARLKKLAASWQIQRIYQEGITAVIAGRPNAGKSSLFNLLLKEDRSIVTDIPGTTRDWIEALVSIEGIPVRLIDTAGLRESADPVEKIGVERSRELLESADIVLYLIDGAEWCLSPPGLSKRLDKPTGACHLFIWNKADIAPLPAQLPAALSCGLAPMICFSAKTGEGLAELHAAIALAIREQMPSSDAGSQAEDPRSAALGSQRQKTLVDAAAAALEEALALAERGEPLDLIAPLLREAVNSLGEITGEVSTADILEEMFSRFCVGK